MHPRSHLAPCVAVAVLLAACGTTPTPAPVATLDPSPEAAGPSQFANRVYVSGTLNCDIQDVVTAGESGGIMTETARMSCSFEMSDARVTGSEQADLVMNWATVPADHMEHFFSENDVMTNDGGTWRGCGWGSEYYDDSLRLHTTGVGLYLGEGAYKGLSFHIQFAQGPDLGPNYLVSGWIEPTDSRGEIAACR